MSKSYTINDFVTQEKYKLKLIDNKDGTFSQSFAKAEIIADESNIYMKTLRAELDNNIENQNLDGSLTNIRFSTDVVPHGKVLLVSRIILYMEDSTDFTSEKFAGLTKLTNGWAIEMNSTEVIEVKDNKGLMLYMFDFNSGSIFGKENRTMIARLSFNKFTSNDGGIMIDEGETFSTIIKDDLSEIDQLIIMVEGIYKDKEGSTTIYNGGNAFTYV